MGGINNFSSLLSIVNYAEMRRPYVNHKELKIETTMEFGQSRVIGWDHVVEVNADVLAKPSVGRLPGRTTVWERRNLIRSTSWALVPAVCDALRCRIQWEPYG